MMAIPAGPSADHRFGVDRLGHDIFARTIHLDPRRR
jgi:ABC-type microcin C transport system permease subunit YejE